MCCCRINTETLLANLFSKLERNDWVPWSTLQEYFDFLSEWFVTYVVSDFCKSNVIYCVEEYPELYEAKENVDGLSIRRGELIPNLEYFNAGYNESIAKYIENLTTLFLEQRPK